MTVLRTAITVTEDKAWEAVTAPLLADCLLNRYGGQLQPANQRDDRFHGTDFLWHRQGLTARLAVRVRKAAFLKYKADFTIREDRPHSEQKTELEKIRAGDWAAFYAYAFSDGDSILHWSLFRMSRFDPDAPFRYMPGFGPGDKQDTITRIYTISDQSHGFLIHSVTPYAPCKGRVIPLQVGTQRTAA